MALDLGELRASIVVDRSQVGPGLAAARRQIEQATRGIATDTDRAGQLAGEKLGEGITRGADGKLRDAHGRLVGAGRRMGDDVGGAAGKGISDGVDRGLKDSNSRLTRWADRAGSIVGRGVAGGVKGVGSAVGTVGSALARGGADLSRYAAGGVLAMGAVAGAAAALGGSVASSNEQATISFSTMLRKGDDTAADAHKRAVSFIGDLQRLAATTPFEFSDLQSYASSLVSAGMDVKDIIPTLRNLGDVTAGVGTGAEGIDRATVALQQMIAAQKISGEDLAQLRDAGIPVYDLLASATGKSKAEVVQLAQSGKLGKKELGELLNTLSSDAPKGLERFSGLMSKQSSSLKGMWSNLTDTVSQGLGRIGTRAMPELKRGVGEVQAVLGRVFSYLDKHSDDITRIFRAAGRTVRAFGGIAKPAMEAFTGSLSGGQDALTSIADWLDSHQADVVDFFVGAGHAAIGFGKVVAVVVSGALHAYAGLQKGIQAVLDFILSSTQAALSQAAAVASSLGLDDTAAALMRGVERTQELRDRNAKNTAGADVATKIADGIDGKLLPALRRADGALDDYGKKAEGNARKSDAWRGSLNAITRSVQENGRSLSEHTKAGRENRQVIESSVRALNKDAQAAYDNKAAKGDLKGAERAAAKVIRDGTDDIRDQAKKAGLNKDAVKRMIDKLLDIPKARHTDITFSTNAQKVLVKLQAKWGAAQGSTKGNQALANSDRNVTARGGLTGRFMGQLPGNTPLVRGDDMALPLLGGGEQHLRGGEGVQITEAMDPYEQRRLNAMNHGVLAGLSPARVRQNLGESMGLARGGIAGSALPASVMELGPDAMAFAANNARRTALAYAAATRKTLQGALNYTSGGNTGAALAYARAHEGHPYVYGTLWDCSGLVSALHSIALGQQPHRRYTTTAFHGSHAEGFTRGKHSNFMVGVNPNPGKSGHMAATINGVNVEEAGGVGLRVGGSARGWDSPMFSWRGGLARGGRVVGDLPFDLVNKRGQRYSPILEELADALLKGKGYAAGTDYARSGFAWTAEKAAEVVVNPQMRRYTGGERVLSMEQAHREGIVGGQGGTNIGTVNLQHSGASYDALNVLAFKVRTNQLGRKGRG